MLCVNNSKVDKFIESKHITVNILFMAPRMVYCSNKHITFSRAYVGPKMWNIFIRNNIVQLCTSLKHSHVCFCITSNIDMPSIYALNLLLCHGVLL